MTEIRKLKYVCVTLSWSFVMQMMLGFNRLLQNRLGGTSEGYIQPHFGTAPQPFRMQWRTLVTCLYSPTPAYSRRLSACNVGAEAVTYGVFHGIY